MILTSNRKQLEQRLGYQFKDVSLLALALTHRSYGANNNERLEFLGDSILNFVVGHALLQQLPQAREGQLSRLRAQLVKGETLAEIAREFGVGDCLILGEGEAKSGGQQRESILADSVEAIIGAIFSEAGFDFCRERILAWYETRLAAIQLDVTAKDPKSQLQEFLQAKRKPLPEYKVVEMSGESHAQVFTLACKIDLLPQAVSAQARSRREAEKLIATEILKQLGQL